MFQPSPPLLMRTFVLQDGWSPLLTSCSQGHLDVVKILIEARASINQADKVSTHIPTRVQYDIRACDQCISVCM